MDLNGVAVGAEAVGMARVVGIFFCVGVVTLAAYALLMHDTEQRSPVGHLAYRLVGNFGSGEVLFSIPAIISIVASCCTDAATLSTLLFFWLAIVVAKPVERFIAAIRQFRAERSSTEALLTVGTIVRVDHPDIIRVKLNSDTVWRSNRLFTASLPDGTQRFVLSLFAQTQGTEVIGTALCVGELARPIILPTSLVCSSHDDEQTKEFLKNLSGSDDAQLVGFVVENSSIGLIQFEVSGRSDLHEGDVVFVWIKGQDIFYQIIDAKTYEETFDQNPRGTHVVQAAQLGVYTAEEGFTKYQWLPAMNTPIFSASSRSFDVPIVGDREVEIGKVPSTNISAVARLDDLVEYHTAVLGVTGTGKTEMALDIVREAVANKTKVFCVDFTGDYAARLSELGPIFPSPTDTQSKWLEDQLFEVATGKFGAPEEKKVLQKGVDKISSAAEEQINDFLKSEENYLAIFELAEITNTKATLRLTELYLSTIMRWAQANRRARQILIVLEEAHTIVPEVFGSGFDSDTQYVVSRIGQIALQGRKYRVGLMVISQRTALVSKTILSQCNTFLTHSLIDQTSLSFLESVHSSQHARLIPNLGRFEFLASGKAIKAERPIVLRRDFDQAKEDASKAVNAAPAEKIEPEALHEEVVDEAEADQDRSGEGPRITQF